MSAGPIQDESPSKELSPQVKENLESLLAKAKARLKVVSEELGSSERTEKAIELLNLPEKLKKLKYDLRTPVFGESAKKTMSREKKLQTEIESLETREKDLLAQIASEDFPSNWQKFARSADFAKKQIARHEEKLQG